MADLKPGWKRVKFGQIAECINDRVDDPSTAGVERYVGLEHLDSESLSIRRWGAPDDVESTKLRFRPGDIIFGKRRAYQRKLAVANFEGICSAHAMVLRGKPAEVVPEFLPFFMQSDVFMTRAVEISVGSLSPTINWKTLAMQEFAMPPATEQRRIARLLSATTNVLVRYQDLAEQSRTVLRSALTTLLPLGRSRWPQHTLDSVVARFIDYRGRTPNKTAAGVPLLTAKNVRDGFVDYSNPEWIATDAYDEWMTRGIPKEGDVLFTTEAPLGLVARAPAGRFALAQRIICLQPSDRVEPDFLYWVMRSPAVQHQVHRRSTGTTVAGIKQAVLRKITIPLPALNEQRAVASTLNDAASSDDAVQARCREAARMARVLLEENCAGNQ